MNPYTFSSPRCTVTFGLLALAIFLGCNRESDAPGSVASQAAEPEIQLVYPLPEGSSEELLDFINKMAAREPEGTNDEERTEDIGHMMQARMAAADKLYSLPEGAEQFAGMWARTKLESLRVLQMIGKEGGEEQFIAFSRELSESENEEIASVGKIGLFQQSVDQSMNQQDAGESVIESYQQLIADVGATEPVFFAGQEASMMLRQSGNLPAAIGLLEVLGASFSNHANQQVASEAMAAMKATRLLSFDAKFRELMTSGGSAGEELVAMAHQLLAEKPIEATALGIMMQAAQQMEYSGRVETAQQLYAKISSATNGTDVSQQIANQLESAEKRLALIGEPFDITGQVVGGGDFDWSEYEGNVVLVDFWATWCGPCLREVPNLKKNFARFKDQGFRIVSVNLDNELETVENFLADSPLPWPTVVGQEPDEFGFDNPNALRCGVQAIPFLVLVNQQGDVAALHVRDRLLEEKLIELLGEPEEEVLEIKDPDAS